MTNNQRTKEILKKFGFNFEKIGKSEIQKLIEKEIAAYQSGSSEYIRVLCGYLFCVGDASDIPLLRRAKEEISFDVGCMIDGDWIESLLNGGKETKTMYGRKELIADFIRYYSNFETDNLEDGEEFVL